MQGGGRFLNTLQDYMGVGELGCTWDHKFVLRNEWTAPFGEYRMIYVKIDTSKIGFPLEHKTCDILAAERLRLMRFDNRLIIDSFQEAICLAKW